MPWPSWENRGSGHHILSQDAWNTTGHNGSIQIFVMHGELQLIRSIQKKRDGREMIYYYATFNRIYLKPAAILPWAHFTCEPQWRLQPLCHTRSFHLSYVGKLVQDLFGSTAALARYIGKAAQVNAIHAFNGCLRYQGKLDAWRVPQRLINAETPTYPYCYCRSLVTTTSQ